jgi:hypothetical protein
MNGCGKEEPENFRERHGRKETYLSANSDKCGRASEPSHRPTSLSVRNFA